MLAAIAGAASRGSGGVNAPDQAEKPYLILVSIDGFRWDYTRLFPAPAITGLAARGIRAEALIPVFPTLTFPNHYTLATGLYPSRHGIVANTFRDAATGKWYEYKQRSSAQDGSWYGGEPVWVAAEKAGMVTAAYFFVGTEADIQGIRPSYWRAYDKQVDGQARVNQVLKWLRKQPENRPHLVTLYFDDVDDNGHWYGPESPQLQAAISRVDGYVQHLLDGLSELPFGGSVSVVLVSDHGQSGYDPDSSVLILDQLADLSGIDAVDGGTYVFLYFEQPDIERARSLKDRVNQAWRCGNAYLPGDLPPSWEVGDSSRNADVYLVANVGCAVLSSSSKKEKITAGDHGWPPDAADMAGIFVAAGPGIPSGVEIGPVRAVDVYPFLMQILELPIPSDIDSRPEILLDLLNGR